MSSGIFGKLFGGSDDSSTGVNKPRVPSAQPARTPTTHPTAPAKPPFSERPMQPTRPTPTQTQPMRPTQPAQPARPIQPAHPTQPAQPTHPAQKPNRPMQDPALAARQAAAAAAASNAAQAAQIAKRPTGIPAAPPQQQTTSNEKEADFTINDLLALVVEQKGSDLHLTVGSPPMLRLQGKLWPTDLPMLTAKDTRRLIYQFLTNAQRERFEKDLELDISYELENVSRYRCNIFITRLGLGAVFRVIPTKIKTLQELHLPMVLSDLARRQKGLILVTGPTGSGKSTTLAAMLDQINIERHDHILTIEDPIEFVHHHKSCIVNQREIGPNTRSFANALRSALREDPDIILVGEMRDYETISLAVTAAETGHLVLATLHTPSAAQSVDRIVDVFPSHQQDQIRTQLADALQGIVAQQLIPTVDESGRCVAIEIMINTSAVANLIRDNKTFQLTSIMQTSKQAGMQTMDQSLLDLVKQHKISPQEAYRRAYDKKTFERYKPRDM